MPPDSTAERWARISDAIADLAPLSAAARQRYLDACDAPLRAEVTRYLDALDTGAAIFAEPALRLLGDAPPEHDMPVPERVGVWRIVRVIGRGGMGAVYEGVREEGGFTQRAAIKMIHGSVASPAMASRFIRERDLLARLTHPNIATLLDGGVDHEGRPWFAMELIDGEPITAWCDRRRLALEPRMAIFRQVCDAVQHAHRELVVHRDLKPGNILVTAAGAKLLDFGIATLLADDRMESGTDTLIPGAVPLTPSYASPEQLAGHRVSTASDIYSLGVILHELLTGTTPFVFDGSLAEFRERVTQTAPPPLSTCVSEAAAHARNTPMASLRHYLRGDIARVVAMALRRDPARRYASAEQLGADVANVMAHRPVIARADTLAYRVNRFVARNRAATALTVVLFTGLAGAAAVAIDRSGKAEIARAAAVAAAARSERVASFLSEVLASPDPWTGDRNVTVREVLDQASVRAGRDFHDDPVVEGTLRLALARSYHGVGRFAEAEREYLAADRLLAEGRGQDATARIDAQRGVAELLGEREAWTQARAWYDSAGAIARAANDSLAMATVDADLAWLFTQRGVFDSAGQAGARALGIRERHGASPRDIANSLNNLAVVELNQGRADRAASLLDRAVSLLRTAGPEGRAPLAAALATLGGLASDQGDTRLAEARYRESLALRRTLFGVGHPDEIGTLVNLASNALDADRPAAALALTDTVLSRIVPGGLPPTHGLVAAARTVRGRALVALDRPQEGERELRTALALRRRILPAGHPSLAFTLIGLAEALERRGQYTPALDAAREAVTVLTQALGDEHPRTAAARAMVQRLQQERTNR